MRSRWRRSPAELAAGLPEAAALGVRTRAARIVAQVRQGGDEALRRWAEVLDSLPAGAPLLIERSDLAKALAALSPTERSRLERVANRIRGFAEAQRRCLQELSVPVDGGAAGHRVVPVAAAGCYAPGGRYPLPSSVLMTAVTARVAGVPRIWVASPRPTRWTLAAAAIADADGVLAVGGAQAIAALAYGIGGVDRCPVIVGPGNEYVTAAKLEVAGVAAIDAPAGPSELLIVADETADREWLAADLLAQAEHDPRARPMLLATTESLVGAVEEALERRLRSLSTRAVAVAALERGGLAVVESLESAARWVEAIAPEHLQLSLRSPESVLDSCSAYGAAFIGERSAEVFGDYGVGPNHVLPTGGSARAYAGLSVLSFLRWRPWLRLDALPEELVDDTVWMAECEGLAGHAAAAEARRHS